MSAIDKEVLNEKICKLMRDNKDPDKRDLCPIYKEYALMKDIVSYLAEPFRGKIDYVASPESAGFILGTMIAFELGVGFIPLRNGSISFLEDEDALRGSYIDHKNLVRSLQMRKSNFPAGSKVLLADDWVGTAATMQACSTLIEEAEGKVMGYCSIGSNYNQATQKMIDDNRLRSVVCRK